MILWHYNPDAPKFSRVSADFHGKSGESRRNPPLSGEDGLRMLVSTF
jgi:hypothetical protein